LALTSPTGGGRSVGIVRSRTKATELVIEDTECYFSSGTILFCQCLKVNVNIMSLECFVFKIMQ